MLVVGHGSGAISLWQQGDLGFEKVGELEGHKSCVSSLVFDSDGNRIFSGGDDWLIKVWNKDGDNWDNAGSMKGHSSSVAGLSFNSRSWMLASAGTGE